MGRRLRKRQYVILSVAEPGTESKPVASPPPPDPSSVAVIGPGLGFPFENIDGLAEIRAYGIPDWDPEGPHNGIDVIVNNLGPPEGFNVGEAKVKAVFFDDDDDDDDDNGDDDDDDDKD